MYRGGAQAIFMSPKLPVAPTSHHVLCVHLAIEASCTHVSDHERACYQHLAAQYIQFQLTVARLNKSTSLFKSYNALQQCAAILALALVQSLLHAADAHRHMQHPLTTSGLPACSRRPTALGAPQVRPNSPSVSGRAPGAPRRSNQKSSQSRTRSPPTPPAASCLESSAALRPGSPATSTVQSRGSPPTAPMRP